MLEWRPIMKLPSMSSKGSSLGLTGHLPVKSDEYLRKQTLLTMFGGGHGHQGQQGLDLGYLSAQAA